ncbi:MAG: 2-phospho-L-lactate guanylyltransferase [Candidatus Methylomirabilaceae bacterium]
MIVAVIPVKELARGKQRLQSILTASERYLLSRTMLEDVLSIVTASPLFDRVLAITSDAEAAALAGGVGAGIIREARQVRQSRSVDAAATICRQMGADAMLTLPLDVPLITVDDLVRIVEKGTHSPGVVLVPSRDRLGTNALLARPPGAIPARFGYDSFRAHRREAEVRGISWEACELPRVSLDIDEIEDLEAFLEHPGRTRTHELLRHLGIGERLGVKERA